MPYYLYRDPHDKNKTVSWPYYLYHWNPHTWKDDFVLEWYTGRFMSSACAYFSGLLLWHLWWLWCRWSNHYSDIIMGTMMSQITSLTIVYSTIYSGADQRKHQSSASLAFVQGIHRWPVNSLLKWPVMGKIFPFDDVIMSLKDMNKIEWY